MTHSDLNEGSAYRIHGVPIRLFCEHSAARERIGRLLCAYAVEDATAGAGIRIEIADGSVAYPTPLHAKRVLRYARSRNYFWDGVSYFTDYFSTLKVAADGSSIIGNLCPETIKEARLEFFTDLLFYLALLEALRFHGLYYLHAAAVQDPDGQGYLICGNGGSGKTSLTLALIHAGFRPLSDDTVFMKLEGERDLKVLGFAREFHVPLDLVEENDFLSYLKDCPGYTTNKLRKLLAPDSWLPEKRVEEVLNPGALIFPELSESGGGVTELPMHEAMTRLLPQSMSVTFHPQNAPAHLEALKRVVRHARAFRLLAGPEMKGNPGAARAMVELTRTTKKEGC